MKKVVQNLLGKFGYALRRTSTLHGNNPGSVTRPVGRLGLFLEDIRARGFNPRGIIDVGAHRGDWSREALSIFPNTPTILIEPQDEMQIYLVELAKTASSCHIVKAGAGREAGELVQTIWEDYAGSSFLPPASAELERVGKQRKANIVKLDKLLAEDFPEFIPDLVKLDIQGFELEALSGADSLFGRTEMFILEVSLFPFMPGMPIAREVIAFMAARGYELYDILGFGRRPYDGALGQMDPAFVKKDGVFRMVIDW